MTAARKVGAVVSAWALISCATPRAPAELVDARTAYLNATAGPAGRMAQGRLQQAKDALDRAEALRRKWGGSSADARTAAYVALRKAQAAQATGEALEAAELRNNADQAIAAIEHRRAELAALPDATPGAEVSSAPAHGLPSLATLPPDNQPRGSSAAAAGGPSGPVAGAPSSPPAAAEPAPVPAASSPAPSVAAPEKRDSLDRLAEVGAVSREGANAVVTFPASTTFAVGETTFSPAAVTRLETLAVVLKGSSASDPALVEVHADGGSSRGADLLLCQQRAEAIRSFLIAHGTEPDRVVARGVGPDRPVPGLVSVRPEADDRVQVIVPGAPPR